VSGFFSEKTKIQKLRAQVIPQYPLGTGTTVTRASSVKNAFAAPALSHRPWVFGLVAPIPDEGAALHEAVKDLDDDAEKRDYSANRDHELIKFGQRRRLGSFTFALRPPTEVCLTRLCGLA
jgi:hypothetical protein